MFTVISKRVDIAGKYRLMLNVNDIYNEEFKFQHDPSDEEIEDAVSRFLAAKEETAVLENPLEE